MDFNTEINANNRTNPLVENIQYSSSNLQRITNIAIPFLNLYKPTALGVSLGMGSVKIWQNLTEMKTSILQRHWSLLAKQSFQTGLVVSSVALSILMPTAGILVSQGTQIISDVHRLGVSLLRQEYRAAAQSTLGIGFTAIYLASALYATPELIALSLLTQAAVELYHASQAFIEIYREFLVGNIPKLAMLEALANVVLASFRIYSAAPHLQTSHRNHFGKKLTTDSFQDLIEEIYENQFKEGENACFDFELMLKKKYISSYLENIDLREEDLSSYIFKNVTFKNCHFEGANLDFTTFQRVTLDKCSFVGAKFFHSIWNQSTISNSDFTKATFYDSLLLNSTIFNSLLDRSVFFRCGFQNVSWINNDMSYACFNDSVMLGTTFAICKLFETNFLGVRAANSFFINSDLTDCLLLDTKEQFTILGGKQNVLSRPVIALSWNFKQVGSFASLDDRAIKDLNGITLKYDYTEDGVDIGKLEGEVKELLAQIAQDGNLEGISIPEEILKRAAESSEISKIKQNAEKIFKYIDGLLLPGGLDIQPELYGKDREENTYTDPDYSRSMKEYAMLFLAKKYGTPTMGICRGSQMGNTYFGGTLAQDVPNQTSVWQELQVKNLGTNAFEILQNILKDFSRNVIGLSMHHQASDQIGKGLTVVLEHNGVPKALISEDGQFIFTQFHPEIYPYLTENPVISDMNKQFFNYLFEKATIYKDTLKKEIC